MSTTTTTTHSTTAHACPVGGCAHDGRPWTTADPTTAEVHLDHERDIADLEGIDVIVSLNAEEGRPGRFVGEDHGIPEFEPIEGAASTFSEPRAVIWGPGGNKSELTAQQARELARALTTAADELDDLSGPSVDTGYIIKATREGYGGSVQQLAEDAGLSVELVQAIEAGASMTHAEHRRLVTALGEAIGRAREDRTA